MALNLAAGAAAEDVLPHLDHLWGGGAEDRIDEYRAAWRGGAWLPKLLRQPTSRYWIIIIEAFSKSVGVCSSWINTYFFLIGRS